MKKNLLLLIGLIVCVAISRRSPEPEPTPKPRQTYHYLEPDSVYSEKQKKMYKLMWEKRLGYKITFVKSSIHKNRVWCCMVNKKI